jgi:SAM-dependent methyltransferase
MGCGTGDDITWWATLESKDDPPVPYNYRCFAVDHDQRKLDSVPDLENIAKLCKDFTKPFTVPTNIDLLWSHDSLQYSTNPLETLKHWNQQMTVNGMLVLTVPQHSGVEYNRYINRTHSGCYYHYTPTNLIYMLAVNGFDCCDAYLLKQFNDPWIQVAVYKSNIAPMDPVTTSWEDLCETGLLNPTVVNSIRKNGHLRQEEIVYPWLDKENYFIDYVSQHTEIPVEAGEPRIEGVFNTSTEASVNLVEQPEAKVVGTNLLKPVGVLRPPKGRYVK